MKKALFAKLCPSFLLAHVHPTSVVQKGLLRNHGKGQVQGVLVITRFLTSFILISNALIIVKRIHCVRRRASSTSSGQMLIIGCPTFASSVSIGVRDFGGQLKRVPCIIHISVSNTIPNIRITGCFAGHPCNDSPSRIGLVRVFTISCSCLTLCSPRVLYKHNFSRTCNGRQGGIILGRRTIHLLNCPSPRRTLKGRLRVRILRSPLRIIKIIGGCRRRSLTRPCGPVLFFLGRQIPFVTAPCVSIGVSNSIGSSHLTRIRRVCQACFPSTLFSCFCLSSCRSDLCGSSHGFN